MSTSVSDNNQRPVFALKRAFATRRASSGRRPMRSLRAGALSVGSTAHCRRSAGFAEKVWVGHSGRPLTDECYSHSRSEAKVTQLSKLTLKVKGQGYCATLSRGPPAPRGWASAGTVLRRTKTPAVEISLIATMGAATGIEQVCLIQIRDHEDDAIEMSDRRGQGLLHE